jgi:photosystem II stability/assembly factor-like uncharacterized protein
MLVWLLSGFTVHSMNDGILPTSTTHMPHFAVHLLFAALSLHWIPQASPVAAGLRGLSVVSEKTVWASGSKGTVLRTLDGGEHWEMRPVEGGDALDFRDVVAFDRDHALVMSSGTGDAARVYLTEDGGSRWRLVLANPDKTGFFDAMKFWDRRNGMLLGDPVDGHFTVFTTEDGGMTWRKATQPDALKSEGAFAASGTCLTLLGRQEAWFGSGGPGGGRVFHTADRGKTWSVATTPLSGEAAASGIFSLKFTDALHGMAAGGDYQKPSETARSLALTSDGGKTWSAGAAGGFRSGISYLRREKVFVAVGTSGSDYSLDGGVSWKPLSKDSLNAVASHGDSAWAVGPKGLIVKLAKLLTVGGERH